MVANNALKKKNFYTTRQLVTPQRCKLLLLFGLQR